MMYITIRHMGFTFFIGCFMIDPGNHIISRSLFAGIAIGIGGYLFLSTPNPILGSVLFSMGLCSIVIFKANLFTGKSAFISDKQDFRRLILVLLLNVFAAYMFGLIVRLLNPSIVESANNVLAVRLNTDYLPYIIKSIITGFLMTLAIESENRQNTNHLILILCVVGFISAGCLHCIADSFYYGASTSLYESPCSFILRLLIVILFNFVGCNLYNLVVNRSFIHKSE